MEADLSAQGEREAASLTELLESQRARIWKQANLPDPAQLMLPGITDAEIAQRRADRRHWHSRLEALDEELRTEPGRIRDGYRVRAARLEMVGTPVSLADDELTMATDAKYRMAWPRPTRGVGCGAERIG